jgi:hypothetical protein
LIAMLAFLLDTLMTVRKIKEKLNFAMVSVIIANTFLFAGVLFGIVLALGYAGMISINLTLLLKGHLYLVVGGYIVVTIFGLSMVLLPMFGLSHHFSWRPIKTALVLMSTGVLSVAMASLFESAVFAYIGYLFSMLSVLLYLYQVFILYQTRARKDHDVYAQSLYVSHASLIGSLSLGLYYILSDNEAVMLAAGWLVFTGFFGFMVTGHLYKIVPFLVWFERFSPLVGKQKVPMLSEMIPLKGAYVQLWFSAIGVLIATFGLLLGSNDFFKSGISFLSVGGIFLLQNLISIMRFR